MNGLDPIIYAKPGTAWRVGDLMTELGEDGLFYITHQFPAWMGYSEDDDNDA